MSTQGKVAVITGAALVKAYRGAGYRVVATARSVRPSDDPDVLAIAGDIGDPKVGERVIAEGFERFGRIDSLVNNAGIFTAKPFTAFTAEDWASNIATNLAGFFYVTQEAIRKMELQ